MNSIVEERVKGYLRTRLHYDPYACGAILFNMRQAARVAGFGVDERFSRAGLSAGPEARVASGIVGQALGGGKGDAVSAHVMGQVLARWLRTTPSMGA